MKAVDCKLVSREVDELERGQQPSLRVSQHLRTCVGCLSFYEDRRKLRQMVADLPAVEAPADFDFRLRARLANVDAKNATRVPAGLFGFGLPAVALATIVLLAGAGISMRAVFGPAAPADPVVQHEEPQVAAPAPVALGTASPEVKEANANRADTATVNPNPISKQREVLPKVKQQVALGAGNRRRLTRDLSDSQALASRREEMLAGADSAVFPLEAAEPLSVSVDYTTGGSRTISLPTLSFGSQQVVSRTAPAMIKTSARTVW